MNGIHPTAILDASVQLGTDIEIGPFAILEPDVVIDRGCRIGAHAVIKRASKIGKRNRIADHVVIGGDPQELSFRTAMTFVSIGDDNVFREGVTIHRASRSGAATRLGNGNYLMAYCHVGHDCAVGHHTVFANGVSLGGHVTVADHAFISAHVAIHQFCRVGSYAMVAGLAKVTQDCLPFVITDGNPARARGINVVGLQRAGVTGDNLNELKRAYRLLLRSHMELDKALQALSRSKSFLVRELVTFIESSSRGFAHHRGSARY